MATQVLRIKRKNQFDASLVAHYRGDTRPVEARERPDVGLPSAVAVAGTSRPVR